MLTKLIMGKIFEQSSGAAGTLDASAKNFQKRLGATWPFFKFHSLLRQHFLRSFFSFGVSISSGIHDPDNPLLHQHLRAIHAR